MGRAIWNRPSGTWRAGWFLQGAFCEFRAERVLGPVEMDLTGIHWMIAGGESGPRRRPMDLAWAQSLRDQCLAARVPFFFKQVGGRTPRAGGRMLDGRTWDERPGMPVS